MRSFVFSLFILMRALYVGAGVDVRPIVALPSISLLVCADGQPFSEFGATRCPGGAWGCRCTLTSGQHCYSRPMFLQTLDKTMQSVGLPLSVVNENERDYSGRVIYFMNTALPDHIDVLRPLSPFDTLIVAGHHPDASVLSLMSSTCTFVGFYGTVYRTDIFDTADTVIGRCEVGDHPFRKFIYVTREGFHIHTDCWGDYLRAVSKDGM